MTEKNSADRQGSLLKPIFSHLHLHSEYSLPDGACRINRTLDVASEMAMPYLAITDHGGLYGAVKLYETVARCHWDMKAIIGTEICVSASSEERGPRGCHLVLLARDNEGYENLVRLVSLSYENGRYANPYVTKSDLEEHSGGLIALSGCAQGEVPSLLDEGQEKEAREAAANYARIFGENDFYLELTDQGLCGQAELNAMMTDLAGSIGLPVVATNNVHYMRRSDAKAHSILVGLRNGDAEEHPGGEFYLKSPEEMEALFACSPEAIRNTEAIAYRCNVELPLMRFHKPTYIPTGTGNPDEHLRSEAEQGLAKMKGPLAEGIDKRLEEELGLIKDLGLSGYFLLVADVIRFARQAGIRTSARGSSSSSLVNFALGVTPVDPVAFDLPFERFLNCDTRGVPDFDFDVSARRRKELVEYLVQKHGKDRVAQIISFSRMRARGAVREASRQLGFDGDDTSALLRALPGFPGISIRSTLQDDGELTALCENEPLMSEAVYLAMDLESFLLGKELHSAGLVLAEEGLSAMVPLESFGDDAKDIYSQYDMYSLESFGLAKLDLVGSRTQDLLATAVEKVSQSQGIRFDLDAVPLDDDQTFQLIRSCDTKGIFRLQGHGIRTLIREIEPADFNELVALMTLHRPGPIFTGLQRLYIDTRNHPEKLVCPPAPLEPFLSETGGLLLYREQVMQIAMELAGYSGIEANSLCRDLGKKKNADQNRTIFIQKLSAAGMSDAVAADVFRFIWRFGSSAGCKAHEVAWTLVSYQSAFLKAHYPSEYQAASLDVYGDKKKYG